MFTDGFTINGKHSYADYGLNVKKRQLGFPAKRSIRKTVPFMNGYHDFTRINGGDTWGERLLSYTFDIIGNTPAEVDAECTRILNWLGNVHEADIYDDTMPEYHLHGSFESASPTESEDGEHTELTVAFVCQPFKIANAETVIEQYRGTEIKKILGQPVRPNVEAVTGGYWYYRENGAPLEENKRADLYAGTTQSPYVIGAGEYIFGFAPTNQITHPFTSGTVTKSGIEYTDNGDGTLTANGTATANAWYTVAASFLPPVGEYRATGGKDENCVFRLDLYRGEEFKSYYERGDGGVIVDITEDVTEVRCYIYILNGSTVDNITFTPALHGKVRMSWTEAVL